METVLSSSKTQYAYKRQAGVHFPRQEMAFPKFSRRVGRVGVRCESPTKKQVVTPVTLKSAVCVKPEANSPLGSNNALRSHPNLAHFATTLLFTTVGHLSLLSSMHCLAFVLILIYVEHL